MIETGGVVVDTRDAGRVAARDPTREVVGLDRPPEPEHRHEVLAGGALKGTASPVTGATAPRHARLPMNLMVSFVGTSAPDVMVTSRVTLEPAVAVDVTVTVAVMR